MPSVRGGSTLSRILVSAFAAVSCGGGAEVSRPNILLVSLDTTRADHCSAHGYARDTTPNLTRLAEAGLRFEAAYAPSSTTSPSHATMFTGQYPISHRVLSNGLDLAEHHRTLAEALGGAGYQTAAVVSSFVLHSKFGLAQGFEVYDDDLPLEEALPRGEERTQYKGEELNEAFDRRAQFATSRALRWLERERDPARPFFLFVHYMDPHNRIDPPEPYLSLFANGPEGAAINRYDAMIAYTDQELGRLVDGLARLGLEDTLVVVTGDHGEGLMEHGYMTHGVQIYEESVRVPFVVRWSGRVAPGSRRSEPIELVDLAPTLLELAGVPEQWERSRGRSLADAWTASGELEPEREVFLFRRPYADTVKSGIPVRGVQYGLRAGRWKLIWGPDEGRVELYDLAADPGESEDLSGEEPERVAAMRARIETLLAESDTSEPVEDSSTEIDREKLRALGYVR